jgi:hypothetical protein
VVDEMCHGHTSGGDRIRGPQYMPTASTVGLQEYVAFSARTLRHRQLAYFRMHTISAPVNRPS